MADRDRRGPAVAALVVATIAAGLICGCRDPGELRSPDVTTTRWTIRNDQEWFGFISQAVRCGDVLFLADLQGKIRPLDVVRRRQLPILRIDGPPLGLAADCERQVLYAVLPPAGQSSEPTVAALEFPSGLVVRRYRVPVLSTPGRGAYFSAPSSLLIAGVVHPEPEALFTNASAESFYRTAHIGLKLSLTTGATEPMFTPYEQQCIGGGQCLEVSMAPSDVQSLVALPSSTHVAVYDDMRQTPFLIDITSPLFLRNGRALALGVSAEDRVRWTGENSTIFAVYQFREYIATIHARPRLKADWVLGQPLDFTVLMNLHSYDGRLVGADLELPDLPVGQDADSVFVIDYGERGRAGSSPTATLSMIHVS